MQRIYILDQDKRFAARLGHVLAGQCPKYHFLSVGSPEEMTAFCEEIGQSAQALIYTASQFPSWSPDPALNVLYMREKPNLKDLYGSELTHDLAETVASYHSEVEEAEADDSGSATSIYRLAGAGAVKASLETLLAGHTVEEDDPGFKTCLLYAPCPGRAAEHVWERLLAVELDKGRRIIGLPLTPPHLFKGPSLLLSNAPADRANLATLLMRLEYDELAAADILPYLVPTRQGCLSLAPSSGADDINEVKPEVLLRLLKLMQSALQNSSEETSLFIFASGLANSRIRKLLPYCDELITLTDPEGVQNDAWSAVLNAMLSDLPAGRRHRELWEEN